MTSLDFVKLALQMTTMLAFAIVFGEIMRRIRHPAVVGEMIGGILLFLSSATVTVRDVPPCETVYPEQEALHRITAAWP